MLDHTNEDDGTFFIAYDDFIKRYGSLSICCNPNPTIYTHQKQMIDLNQSEFPSVAFLRVELAADIELTEETFAVFCNQQGDVLAGYRRATKPHKWVLIETLVFDGENKVVFDSR